MKTAFDFLPPLLVNAFHQETEIGLRLSDSIYMFKSYTSNKIMLLFII